VATRGISDRITEAALASPPRLTVAASAAGLDGRVTLVDSPESCSFVYGALVPRVAISSGLLARLSYEELRATLEHERYHVETLDPLRSALADAAVDGIFFLPALRTLRSRYEAARELAADRQAVEVAGTGALLKAMEGSPVGRPATIPLASAGLIESRLTQLENEREPNLGGVRACSLVATALGVIVFVALLAGAPLGSGDTWMSDLGPAAMLKGTALCILPLAGVAGLGFRRMATHSARRA
jgi:BlaR1 peptidase M56